MSGMMSDGTGAVTRQQMPAPWVFDLLLGIAVTLTVSLFIAADIGDTDPAPWAYLWAVFLGALMLARRRYPATVMIVSAVVVIAYHAGGYPPMGISVPLAAAAFSAAEFGRSRVAIAASAAVVVLSVTYRLFEGQDPAYVVAYELPGHALILAGAIALGDSVRSRRELRRQSEQIAGLIADRYARETERRILAERLAIARELHDSVGHALTVVNLHTQVVEDALGTNASGADAAGPDAAKPGTAITDEAAIRRSLKTVAETASATLADLRRTVTSLRQENRAESRSPLKLTDLGSATLPAVDAGLDVTTRLEVPSALPPTVEAAVYRIVQESITNVVRHAEASRVDINIRETDGVVKVSVRNDDRALPPPRAESRAHGHGIAGMRERALLLGGEFSASSTGEGFAVEATIPLEMTP